MYPYFLGVVILMNMGMARYQKNWHALFGWSVSLALLSAVIQLMNSQGI